MDLLCQLSGPAVWREFYAYKMSAAHFSKREARFFDDFITSEGWRSVTNRFERGELSLSLPTKKLVNKIGTQKKRVVYSFTEKENSVLKLLAFLLYRYDANNLPCLYSFRRGFGAKRAVNKITSVSGLDEMYCCKLDIKNYFNSIDISLLLPQLKALFADDSRLYDFFEQLLTRDAAVFEGEVIYEKRGAMAGTPVSPFLANVYLRQLDLSFYERGIPYARYSDDIIFFAPDEQAARGLYAEVCAVLSQLGLCVNEDKLSFAPVSDGFDYLGINRLGGRVDLSRGTIDKLKGKIRRKARAIHRWKLRKCADDRKAVSVFFRALNRKLYENKGGTEFTWARWFFPLLTSDAGLRELDAYIQQYARYAATGTHAKSNYRIRYAQLKECGCRSLVNEYYAFKKASALPRGEAACVSGE